MKISNIFNNDFKVIGYYVEGKNILITIESVKKTCGCPNCGKISKLIHSKYKRSLSDLPISEYKVRLNLIAHKFYCNNIDCDKKVFTERFNSFVNCYSRITNRLKSIIEKLSFVISSETAAKIISSVYMKISSNSIIRIIRKADIVISTNYEHIGIDDWAFKKRKTYGTIICDLKTKKPVDILSNRNKETLIDWIKKHPEVKIISRDRASGYIAAISEVPNIIQIANRWHLLKNLFDNIDNFLKLKYSNGIKLDCLNNKVDYSHNTEKIKIKAELVSEEKHNQKEIVISKVKQLYNDGLSKSEISRILELNFRTVEKYINMELPFVRKKPYRTSLLDDYKLEILDKYKAGVNVKEIYADIKNKGYEGSERLIRYLITSVKKKNKGIIDNNIIEKNHTVKREQLQKLL